MEICENVEGFTMKLAGEIYCLPEIKQNVLIENAGREGRRQRIDDMGEFLNEQSYELNEYDEQFVRTLLDKITVYDDH